MKYLTQRFVFALFVAALLGFAITGCETAEGFGKDMENAGEEIQDGVN